MRIKPKKVTDPEDESKEVVYFYIVYDLCYTSKNAQIMLKMKNTNGDFKGQMTGKITPVAPFKVHCMRQDSDWFTPREYHGSCQGPNQ